MIHLSFSSSDKNECDEFNGGCDETCVNTAPGHHCLCKAPLELHPDGKTCIGEIVGCFYSIKNP